MQSFFIKQLTIEGEGMESSTLFFKKGVNIIVGPTGTGKTMAMKCLHFFFEKETIPFSAIYHGYSRLTLTLGTSRGDIEITRSITTNAKGSQEVPSSNIQWFECQSKRHRTLTFERYEKELLALLGIHETYYLYSNPEKDTKPLNLSLIARFFYLPENQISTGERSMLLPNWPGEKKATETTIYSTLLFLANGPGKDRLSYVTGNKEKRKSMKQEIYILKREKEFYQKQCRRFDRLLEEKHTGDLLTESQFQKAMEQMHSIVCSIQSIKKRLKEITDEEQSIISSYVETSYTLHTQGNLDSMYQADMNRINHLLTNGPILQKELARQTHSDMTMEAFNHSIKSEWTRYNESREALAELIQENVERIKDLLRQYKKLNREDSALRKKMQTELNPQKLKIHQSIEEYRQAVKETEVYSEWKRNIRRYQRRIYDLYQKLDGRTKYLAKKDWTDTNLPCLQSLYAQAVKESYFPYNETIRIQPESMDAVIDGKPKKDHGEGHRAFLNSLLSFTLLRYINQQGILPFPLLLLDSPIMSMKEEPHWGNGIKFHLIHYMITHCGDQQIIIAENEIPEGLDPESFHKIEFTGVYGKQRVRLLLTPPQNNSYNLFYQPDDDDENH